MKLYAAPLALMVVLAPASCGQQTVYVPSQAIVEYHVPEALRNCPTAPRSPGRRATRAQTAKYAIGLYHAWRECHGNLQLRNRLYDQWRRAVVRANNGECPSDRFCRDLVFAGK